MTRVLDLVAQTAVRQSKIIKKNIQPTTTKHNIRKQQQQQQKISFELSSFNLDLFIKKTKLNSKTHQNPYIHNN